MLTRRRFGLLPTTTHLPVQPAWAVSIRAQLRDSALAYQHPGQSDRYLPPDNQLVALCGLVVVLDLASFLYLPDLTAGQVDGWRYHVVTPYHRQIREVVAAVDDGRGDLAVAAMA